MTSRFSPLTALATTLLLLGALAPVAEAQTVAFQGFEGTAADTWTIAAGAGLISNDVGNASETPAGQRVLTGTNSWQSVGAENTLDLAAQSTAGFTGVSATIRLTSTSKTTGNGTETSDNVRVFVALNGGAFSATPDIFLAGAASGTSNQRWGYDAPGTATTTAGTPITAAGSSANGPSTLVVNIPDGTTQVALRIVALNNSTSEVWNVDDVTLSGTSGTAIETASVAFNPTSATTTEDAAYTAGTFVYTLVNSDGNAANNPDATGTVAITSGNAAEIASFTTSYSFTGSPADGATQAFSATPANDMVFNSNRDVTFELTATASTASGTFTLTITDDEPVPPAAPLWINEFHYDNDGGDTNEFVEVAVRSGGAFNAADYSILLYNGNGGGVYDSDDLSTFTASAPVAISGSAETVTFYSLVYPSNGIQNGPDAIALVNTVTNTVVQFISYEGTVTATDGVASGQTSTDVGVSENGNANDTSIGYTGSGQSASDFEYALIDGQTTGAVNTGQTLSIPAAAVTVTQTLATVAGYRMLSTPVRNVTVGDLAAVNLVQGVPAGNGNTQQQYPTAVPNIYTQYQNTADPTGNPQGTTYTAAPSTGFVIEPGRGFFWLFYNQAITPDPAQNGGGTSTSATLGTATDLTAMGPEITTTVSRAFEANAENFYMVGNPFARPISASAITETGGVGIQDFLQVWDPGTTSTGGTVAGTYVAVDRTGTIGQTALAVWQGAFAEASGAGAVTIQYDATVEVPTAPTFIGRSAVGSGIALSLTGVTASEAQTTDLAAIVRFADDASAGWDTADASKLTPPGGAYALLAPVMTRNGAPYRTSVNTLPLASATVPVAFVATEAGTYTLSADLAGLPQGWTAELRDVMTGTVSDLATGYTFTADATEWTTRFELVITQRGAVAGENGPVALSLSNPAPNPTTRRSTMALTVDVAQHVTATVVDALGRTVATVFDADMAAGADAQITVDASAFAPGIYVVRVAGETFAEARRITVAR